MYLQLDEFRNNPASKNKRNNINTIAEKIKKYAKTSDFILPKTTKERQEEEEAELTDTEEELLREQVSAVLT